VRGAEQEVTAGLGERTQHQPVIRFDGSRLILWTESPYLPWPRLER
jgi:hypothetical protein